MISDDERDRIEASLNASLQAALLKPSDPEGAARVVASGSANGLPWVTVGIPMREPAPLEGPPLPWWLDDDRMLQPLILAVSAFLPDAGVASLKKRAVPDGVTYVWPGEPGYTEATDRIVRGSMGLLRHWENHTVLVLTEGGVEAPVVFRHGYMTREPMFSRSRSAR